MKTILLEMVQYNLWANQRIKECLSGQSDEILNQVVKSSFPTLKLTLLHLWDGEYIWLSRLLGSSPTGFPSENFNGNNEELFEGIIQTSKDFIDFVTKQDEEFYKNILSYNTTNGVVYEQEP